ncbi:MAG: S1 RNA-binding domain-containing protein [Chloroflexi bacterium]|nr:S1 RNA-binding domain-containing protein [Chloroflexota bacterium]
MESNNPNLGNDMEPMSETEQTIAETQANAELPADETVSETEHNEIVPEETSPETPEDSVTVEDSAPDAEEASDEATEQAPEPVAEQHAESMVEESAAAADDGEFPEAEVAEDAAPAEDPAEPAAEAEAVADPQAAAEPEAPPEEEGPRLRKGMIVDGTVIETSPTEVLINLGEDVVGVVASKELERMDRESLETLLPDSPVTAYVLKPRGADGRPVLSLARAEEEMNWRLAEEHHTNQDVYFSKVAGYNKGGLIVRFGKVRGFVPASQISRERQQRSSSGSPEERWGSMVGEEIAVKVVEIDRSRNRLILSERAAAREWREKQKARLLEELAVGENRVGRVISLADFGAFVDLGGADGLVHLTELSWKHVTHPREVLEVGQEVEVQVISIDRQRKRIGLSMKRQEDDPWQQIARNFLVGQLVQATVTKLTKFGAFARLVDAPEIEGLIHISELADYRVSHPREVVLVGDVLTLRIVKIDLEQRRLGLSLRQVDSAKFMDQDWQALVDDFDNGSDDDQDDSDDDYDRQDEYDGDDYDDEDDD